MPPCFCRQPVPSTKSWVTEMLSIETTNRFHLVITEYSHNEYSAFTLGSFKKKSSSWALMPAFICSLLAASQQSHCPEARQPLSGSLHTQFHPREPCVSAGTLPAFRAVGLCAVCLVHASAKRAPVGLVSWWFPLEPILGKWFFFDSNVVRSLHCCSPRGAAVSSSRYWTVATRKKTTASLSRRSREEDTPWWGETNKWKWQSHPRDFLTQKSVRSRCLSTGYKPQPSKTLG